MALSLASHVTESYFLSYFLSYFSGEERGRKLSAFNLAGAGSQGEANTLRDMRRKHEVGQKVRDPLVRP